MATPNITLTATLDDLTGAAAGSVANPAKLRIALCNFGPTLPTISGTAMLARTGPFAIYSTGTAISTPLWGNDQITPSNTFYSIEILDGEDNVVQCGAYQLTGSGTYDLSALSPLVFPGQTPLTLSALFSLPPTPQVCGGSVDGANTHFTFTAAASPTPLGMLFAGGVLQTPTSDYSLTYLGGSSWQITFAVAPFLGPVTIYVFPPASAGSRTITAPAAIVVSGTTADNTLFCNFSAPGAITLPSAAAAGLSYELSFIDVSYAAAANNITLSGAVNNAGSYVIATNGGAVTLRSDGTVWRVKSKV